VGQVDTDAVRQSTRNVQQSEESPLGGRGMWSDSSLDGKILVERLRNFITDADDGPHRSSPVPWWLQITANRYCSTSG